MRFLIIGDLHGNKPKIHFENFDAIIAPGDFCSDAARSYMFQALREHLETPGSKEKEWWELVGKKKAKYMIQTSLRDGRKILTWLNSLGKPVYIVPGNWDWTAQKSKWSYLKKNHYHQLIKGLPHIINVYHKKIETPICRIIGHGITSGPEYPQNKKDLKRFTAQELKTMKLSYHKTLQKLNKYFISKKPIIFISHNVPFHTLDKITNKSSPRYGQHFGSLIARTLVEHYQPLVCIGGHMHEHFGKYLLKKTTVINAGFGAAVNTLLEIKNGKITKLLFAPKTYGEGKD